MLLSRMRTGEKMTDQYNSKKITTVDGNILKDLILRARLIMRLMNDSRVNGLVKLLPLGSLAYLIFPIDLIPGGLMTVIGAADDVAVMWFGFTLFLELCPAEVVEEHLVQLTGKITPTPEGDIVEGEITEVE
ncbi:MAG: DUF1232 domain-containing protein [Anaerolineae bacterium]|nr:DUF1232 domain-containing protein [Anaerolineae bacterium]MBT7069613.1 DUF1232 domain-containing protein [Anaerolineae bacterium]MBT7324532.1 DUF1232 domain-containing protein [Anaerolineae bacterium]